MGENTDQAMGFRGVPDTTVLAGTSTGAYCPIFPHVNLAQLLYLVNTCLHGFAAKIGKKD
jgi:hypothetical protein